MPSKILVHVKLTIKNISSRVGSGSWVKDTSMEAEWCRNPLESEQTVVNTLSIKCNKNRVYYRVFNNFYSLQMKRKDDEEVKSDFTTENPVFK